MRSLHRALLASQLFVQSLGGDVHYQDAPGGGSEFVIELPMV